MENNLRKSWCIPVCYDEEFGLDLNSLSVTLKRNVDEIVNGHISGEYTVYGIGFLPGFLYLGELSEELILPRRNTPRLLVPKGSVAIAGSQTGIYPQDSPGGWHIIGKTPILFFDNTRKDPCLIQTGDSIRFESISRKKFDQIAKLQSTGKFKLKQISYD